MAQHANMRKMVCFLVLFNWFSILLVCSNFILGCGGHITNVTGVIKYPDWTWYHFGRNKTCEWIIAVNESSKVCFFIESDILHMIDLSFYASGK